MVVLVAACAISSGCEDARAIFGDLSDEMRGQAADEGRSGTLRGLEVVHRAHRVAESVAAAPDPACALSLPEDGYVYTIELTLTREARDASDIEWRETRTFTRDPNGQMLLQMDASFRDDLGAEGAHRPIRMVVAGEGFEGPDPEHVYRRQATPRMRQRVRLEGLGVMQTMLDSVRGWSQGEDDTTWSLGSRPLVCGPRDPDEQSWLRRFDTRAEVVEASLVREPNQRRLEIRWLLEDGVVMKMRAVDQVEPFDGVLEAPEPEAVIDVRRDRGWHDVQDMLDRMEAEGVAEPRRDDAASDSD